MDTIIDDIYFLIYSYILKLNDTDYSYEGIPLQMYKLFTDDERYELYNNVKLALRDYNIKTVFNILYESSLLEHLDNIKNYPVDCEITTPFFRKEFDSWAENKENQANREDNILESIEFSLHGIEYLIKNVNGKNYKEIVYKNTMERVVNQKEICRGFGIEVSTEANIMNTHTAVNLLYKRLLHDQGNNNCNV